MGWNQDRRPIPNEHQNTSLTLQGVEDALVIYDSHVAQGLDLVPFNRDAIYLKTGERWITKPEDSAGQLHFYSVLGQVVDIADRPEQLTAEEYIDKVALDVLSTLKSVRSGLEVQPERLRAAKNLIQNLASVFRAHPDMDAVIKASLDVWKNQEHYNKIKKQRENIDAVDEFVIFRLGKRTATAVGDLKDEDRTERIVLSKVVGLDSEVVGEILDFLDSTAQGPVYRNAISRLVHKVVEAIPGSSMWRSTKLLMLDMDILRAYSKRLGSAVVIGESKAQLRASVEDGLREQQMAELHAAWGVEAGVSDDTLKAYRELCFSQSKLIQSRIAEAKAAA